jgi:hypothetical protein
MLFSTLGNITAANIAGSTPNSTGTINGTSTTVGGQTFAFGIDATTGLIAAMVVVIAIGAIAGIKVLGSGLSPPAVDLIIKGTFFFAVWGLLSTFAYSLLSQIAIFGAFIYFVLTVMYVVGFVQTLGSSGGDD